MLYYSIMVSYTKRLKNSKFGNSISYLFEFRNKGSIIIDTKALCLLSTSKIAQRSGNLSHVLYVNCEKYL